MEKNIKGIALSTVAVILLGTNVYAGMIISDAIDLQNPTLIESKQFGFGGWNFDNVDVRIVNTSNFSGNVGTFNTLDGTYTTMSSGMSFEFDIKDSVTNEIMAHLHGKDWPVGEPAGIKIINNDLKVSNGKPVNCIMTTSYQEYQVNDDNTSGSGYLDAFAIGDDPRPTFCSSPFQTHKRFKINLLPTTVEIATAATGTAALAGVPDGYGKPVEITFNLDLTDTNTSIRRYQVLQKINNYTNKRLDGYKIEVFDENGSTNPALTLSLGEGEGLDAEGNPDTTVDIWGTEDVANMSHGLWGPYEKSGGEVRFDNGFFDYKTVYYDANLSDDNQTISYVGPMLGGNYQDLFGNWLPSIWAPTGIFHDDDHNPDTDGILTAYLGVAPGFTERAWYKRSVVYDSNTPNIDPVYTWALATAQDLLDWTGDWYEESEVEDVLNLGVNYIVNVGLNANIGSKFTIRITPHIDTNQTPPSSYLADPGVVQSVANFNADNIADILWMHPKTGKVSIWYMNADGTYNNFILYPHVDLNWEVQGTVDFNTDGIDDILWRDTIGGEVQITYMNADGSYNDFILYSHVESSWNIESLSDFNFDGINDILWMNNINGEVQITYMNADGSYNDFVLYSHVSLSWKIEGTADFNDDSVDDILWMNNINGEVQITYMNNDGTYRDFVLYNHVDLSWKIKGTADYNDDNINDILWMNNINGEVQITYMNDDGSYNDFVLYDNNPLDWNIEGTKGFNTDSTSDILWLNTVSGVVDITYMNVDGTYRDFVVETINVLY